MSWSSLTQDGFKMLMFRLTNLTGFAHPNLKILTALFKNHIYTHFDFHPFYVNVVMPKLYMSLYVIK